MWGHFKHPPPYRLIPISNIYTIIHMKSTELQNIKKDFDSCPQDRGVTKGDSERTVLCGVSAFCYGFFFLQY